MGISPQGNPPTTWSETENIKWKVELTGDGSNSSPIVWEDKIFFQTAVKTDVRGRSGTTANSGPRRGPAGRPATNIYTFHLVCLDRNTGKQLWQKKVREELPHQGHHQDHGFASYTPATDGKLIWTNFGSRGVYCYDTQGNQLWEKDLGKMDTLMAFGEGGSLAIAGDAVIIVWDHQGESFIIALNKLTGDTIWKKERDESTSWVTPLVVEVEGKTQIIVSGANYTRSYDPKTGDIIWQCSGLTRNVVATPVTGFGMVYCTSGFRGSSLMAIELGRKGDLSGTDAVKWHVREATPYVPSPLLFGEKLYVFSVNTSTLSCYNAKTGKPYFFKERLDEIRGVYASPIAAGNRVYFTGRNGVVYVLKPSEKLEVLSVNKLDDGFDASPAVVGNEIYLKGKKYLYCIAEN
jgi:outer membrane protein assembly factor BamB